MFRAILVTQWKWSKGALLLATLASFAVPMLSVRAGANSFAEMNVLDILIGMNGWGSIYTALAAAIGLAVAMISWAPDHAGRHVYALSLPIERWRYVVLRFAAGALTLSAPVLAIWVGAVLAVAAVTLPAPLEAHPTGLAARFALAALLAYALFFAVSSATKRTAAVLLVVVAVLVASEGVAEITGLPLGGLQLLLHVLTGEGGLLNVFTGRWMLIDV